MFYLWYVFALRLLNLNYVPKGIMVMVIGNELNFKLDRDIE